MSAVRVERIGNATLYLGRCEDVLPEMPKAVLCLTDPPYGINVDTYTIKKSRYTRPHACGGYDWKPVHGDDAPFDPTHLLSFRDAVLWGANNYADRLPPSACWFSWDRKAGKAANSTITDCELAWVRGLPFKTVRQFSHMWAGLQRDSEVGERHLHPTQKPAALFSWCLSYFPKATLVVDPYMGAGGCGIAAARAGVPFVGVEIEPEYFETACRRIEAAQRQSDLFVTPPTLDAAYQRSMFAETPA